MPALQQPAQSNELGQESGRASERGSSVDHQVGEQGSEAERGRDDHFYQMALIFPLTGPTVSAKVDWDDYWILHRQVSRLIGCTVDELMAMHHVANLPSDLHELEAQALIPQRVEEIYHGQSRVAALVDIEYHRRGTAQVIYNRRKARMVPRQRTRTGILSALHLRGECDEGQECLVWRNNRIWNKQNEDLVEIYHGDYLKVAIPPRDENCEEMSLMQREVHEPTRSRSRDSGYSDHDKTATIFAFGSDEIELEEVTGSNIDVINALVSIWEFEREDIMALHIISEPGLTWALIWLLQSGLNLPATFHFDSKVVGLGASGVWNLQQGNLQLEKLRHLVQFTSEVRKGRKTTYEHVKAHSLHPCNDFVDSLAKYEQKGNDHTHHELPAWAPIFCAQNDILDWAWWWFRCLRGEPSVPRLSPESMQTMWRKEDFETIQNRIPDIERRCATTEENLRLDLRIATYNVMTLRDRRNEKGQLGEDWKAAEDCF